MQSDSNRTKVGLPLNLIITWVRDKERSCIAVNTLIKLADLVESGHVRQSISLEKMNNTRTFVRRTWTDIGLYISISYGEKIRTLTWVRYKHANTIFWSKWILRFFAPLFSLINLNSTNRMTFCTFLRDIVPYYLLCIFIYRQSKVQCTELFWSFLIDCLCVIKLQFYFYVELTLF